MSELPLKKLKIVKQYVLATFGQNWGPFSHQNFPANRYFLRPLLSYLAEFLATWQLCMGGEG